jgi:hypothetical protein
MSLRQTATDFRNVIASADRSRWDGNLKEFPNGSCGVVCELLGRYLIEHLGLAPMYVGASKTEGGFGTHAWLECEGYIIDITADQFGQSPIIVARESPWHATWDRDDEPRPPITCDKCWPSYPHRAWVAITAAMTLKQEPRR